MLGLLILLQILLKVTLLRKKLEKKVVTKLDILRHLLLPINCHFLLEKTKLQSVFFHGLLLGIPYCL